MSQERDAPKAASARVVRHPAAEPSPAWAAIPNEDNLPNDVHALAAALALRLGVGVLDCGWFRSVSNPGRFLCLHLVALNRSTGAYTLAQLESREGLLTALHNALGRPVWNVLPAAEEEEEEEAGAHAPLLPSPAASKGEPGAPLLRKARHFTAQWAVVVLLLAVLALRAAPTVPITSLATALVQPLSAAMPAMFQRNGAGGADVTADWPPALRWLDAQPSQDDVIALLSRNDTKERLSMGNTVLHAARAGKEELARNCSSREIAIRKELAAELTAIAAGVEAGQPLLPDLLAAPVRRGNSTLEALSASCAAAKAGKDEEIKRITRLVHKLARQLELLGHGAAAAAE